MNFETWLYRRCKSGNRDAALKALADNGYEVEAASSTPYFMTPDKWVVLTGDRAHTIYVGSKTECVNYLASLINQSNRR